MDGKEFNALSDATLWPRILREADSDVPGAVEAAYIETTETDPFRATAALLIGDFLRVYSLSREGDNRDDQRDTIKRTFVPLSRISLETTLERRGWTRDEDSESFQDRTFAATLRYGDETLTLPISQSTEPRVGLERVRPFIDVLAARLR